MSLVNNATVHGILDAPVTLVDGRFEGEPYVAGAASRPIVSLVKDALAIGDLDGDSSEEAAAILAANTGGSGTFIYLAVFDVAAGSARSIATILLGDRIQVGSLTISDQRIVAETTEHGPGDAMCCPTEHRPREWALDNGQLVERTAAEARRYRGDFVWGHEARSFIECESGREGWVVDATGGDIVDVYEKLATQPYQPVFVEVTGVWLPAPDQGFGADFAESIRIDALLRAEREGWGCDEDLTGFLYRARGNEPSWRLDVRNDSLVFSSMNRGSITFLSPRTIDDASGSSIAAIAGTAAADSIDVRITERRCVDTMSGSHFAFAATVRLGETILMGCAIEGL